MTRERTCILCETVYVSKQEMDEHMRSMLHHRELEKLKGRDCGHECRVCKVKLLSLTDYAGHISSATHKHNVEAADNKNARNSRDEEYFDQALVELIEKRKEHIRKEKEAAAAKLAKEAEEQRKKEDFQQRLKEVKERYRLEHAWQPPVQGFGGSRNQYSWYRGNHYAVGGAPWHNKQGKSATWHAQEPPNLQKWASEEFSGRRKDNQVEQSNRAWGHVSYSNNSNKQSRLPWLSSGGSSNGLYGQNNISKFAPKARPQSFVGFPTPPSFFSQAVNQLPGAGNDKGAPQDAGLQHGDAPSESDHNSGKKTFGSNPKLDKSCRWSPYPVAAGPHSDAHTSPAEKHHKVPKPQKPERNPDVSRPSQPEQRPKPAMPNEEAKPKPSPAERSSSQRDGRLHSSSGSSGSSSQKANKPLLHGDVKSSCAPKAGGGAPPSKASAQNPLSKTSKVSAQTPAKPKPPGDQDGLQITPSRQERYKVLEKRGSSESFNKVETTWHVPEKPQTDQRRSQNDAVRKEHPSVAFTDAVKKEHPSVAFTDAVRKEHPSVAFTDAVKKEHPSVAFTDAVKKEHPSVAFTDAVRKEHPSVAFTDAVKKEHPSVAFTDAVRKEHPSVAFTDAVKKEHPSVAFTDAVKKEHPSVAFTDAVRKEHPSVAFTDAVKKEHPSVAFTDTVRKEHPSVAFTDAVRKEHLSSEGDRFLQSLEVSTSVMQSSEPAASLRDDEAVPDEAELVAEAGQTSESDASKSGEAHTGSGSNTSALSKLDLPPVLKRDLTKHISSKSKAGGHEPNLNIARRVRNLSESRRSDTEKDTGIKPTVRQLISSSGSRRNVNWDQVYQEVRKKQDKGKGMPRFGIEMVPCEQEYQSQEEEEDLTLLEGLQWESLVDASSQGSSRKRSLSESSLAPGSAPSMFSSLSSEEKTPSKGLGSENHSSAETEPQRQPDKLTSATVKVLQRSGSVLGDSSSGTEQCDGQGTGKRRRAAGDAPSTEASCVEHNSKRMKVKSKKERLQIDQLLSVSLREEELSRSLQDVDASLITARAALEAAYMEVQRLMVVKQQVTVEMSTLRNKRIELLKGMQEKGPVEEAPLLKLKEEKMDSFEAERHMPPSVPCPVVTDAAVCSPNPAAERASPPSSSLPSMPVVIKEEPQSPVHVSAELDADVTHWAHSTTPQLPDAHAATPPDPTDNLWSSPERKFEPCQATSEQLADHRETSSGRTETTEKADVQPSVKLSPSRKSSEVGSVGDWADIQSTQSSSVFNMPASPSVAGGRRVRKLKKRKALKKAHGTEQPETSDTEMDEEASRPRWLRQRRRPSGGSQVSTSSLPVDDRDDMNTEEAPQHMAEPPQVAPADDMESLDAEENMEVTAACQDAVVPAPLPVLVPDSKPRSLASNEVSSTSDMDLCKSSESDLPFAITFPKTSSDVSSDHGEDEMPTEGTFDGHQEAVNAVQIYNGLLYTCSGDRTIRAFDLVSHQCVGVLEGHVSKVTCLLVSAAPSLHHRLYSGSSDQTIRCYSLKTQQFEQQFSLSDRVLCLHSRWKTLYAGLANGTVATFNLKTNKQTGVFECHGPRAASCLASLQEGARKILLVGSYDSTISVRDARTGVLLRSLQGHTKSVLCMKVVNDLVFSGSSDHSVYAHNIHTGELVQVFKGHSHAVTVVAVLGKMMVTACLDKLVRVYDIQTQDQLQVYGGHKDMVLCMTVHKNMIYTGCYDGSVQAVKLNLIQNFRCWWHGCSLVFGMTAHLLQHLLNDHADANFQKCRWKNCEEFFCARNSSKQMKLHLQKHAEETEADH